MAKKRKEEWKTWQGVFDQFTERLLFKLVSEGHFERLERIISPGKEAVVFVARRGEDKVAVKIYKLETAKFTKMFDYMQVDPRYQGLKKRHRQVVFAWTQREYRNLLLAREAGMKSPMPIVHRDNILVMEYIGHDEPARLAKDKHPEDPKDFVDKCISEMRKLATAGYVHGDLSEFNILNFDGQPVLIDFSHTVPTDAPNSLELLKRDVENMCRWFSSIGVEKDPEALYRELTS